MTCARRLEQLMPHDEETPVESEFVVQFGIPSEKILQVALDRRVDLIVLGLRRASLAPAQFRTCPGPQLMKSSAVPDAPC
jgi:hypothetical protein